MALSGSDPAYLYARSGIARSGATRSNYVAVLVGIEWIVRDSSGTIVSTTDISDRMLHGSLHVTQALNDEPDTCSFELAPALGPTPQVGQEIRIAWAPGGPPLFHGYVLTTQQDWRLLHRQPPWVAVQCQDPMWRFDARIVTYRFPAQSVTASIQLLVQWFCNQDATGPHPLNFSTAWVEAAMPSIPAVDVVNQRPSTVMRTLLAAVGGGFYLEGLTLHAWANSASEPNQTDPRPLTVDLPTLKAFRLTTEASQVRRRVLVEGQRTSTLIASPTVPTATAIGLGVALTTAAPFVPGERYCRIGSQWALLDNIASVSATGENPPQTTVAVAFEASAASNDVWLQPMAMLPPPYGWVRVGNQYARYGSYLGDPLTGVWRLIIAGPEYPYGRFTVPLAVGDILEWVDGAANMASAGVNWRIPQHVEQASRSQSTDTEVVVLGVAQTDQGLWPDLEGFVQDGRYSYAGAQARAAADLAAFQDPVRSADWVTDDLNAVPGRSQVIALSSATINPAINTTVTILRVDLTFPLRSLPPRRQCVGAQVKPSTFLDLVLTSTN